MRKAAKIICEFKLSVTQSCGWYIQYEGFGSRNYIVEFPLIYQEKFSCICNIVVTVFLEAMK